MSVVAVVIPDVMLHDLAIATLATGANAIVSDNKRARMVRCSAIWSDSSSKLHIALIA